MVKPAWGTKRVCQSCGARFYDLQRNPIVCPKCTAVYDLDSTSRTRRGGRSGVAEKTATLKPAAAEATEGEGQETEVDLDVSGEDVTLEEQNEEDEEQDLIEDASELGEDEEDMAEVIENVDEEEER